MRSFFFYTNVGFSMKQLLRRSVVSVVTIASGKYAGSLTKGAKLLLLIIASTLCISILSCKNKKVVKQEANTFYTCSMHPQIMEPHEGKCPVCGMDLIPVTKNNTPATDEIKLSDQQIQLGNIHVDTIGKGIMGNETVLNATLNFDQQKLTSVSARLMGRIEKLYFKNIGDYIAKGAALLDVYSEELNNAKQEYLLALERRAVLDNSLINFDQVIQSAKTKLLLWGMTEGQVNTLARTKKASPTTTVFSKESGYITALNVQDGDYISEGATVVELANLSTLWAEAQVYTSQMAQLNASGMVTVQIPDLQGKELRGKVEFVNPEINADKRLSLIRVPISNQNNQLKPGMSAYVIIKGQQSNALSLPIDAVLRNGNSATVWVQTGTNTFKNKMVTVGMESNDRIEITGGLNDGDAVVTSGAYLINSEYIFKKGSSPVAGMKM